MKRLTLIRISAILLLCAISLWRIFLPPVRIPAFPYGARSGFLLSSDDVNAGLLYPSEVRPSTVEGLLFSEDREGALRILHALFQTGHDTGVPVFLGLCPRFSQWVSDAGQGHPILTDMEEDAEVSSLIREGVTARIFSAYSHDPYHCFRWDVNQDGESEPVAWHNPEANRPVNLNDLLLAGQACERVTGLPMIAFRSPGYRPYLNEAGYQGSPEEKVSRLLKPHGYEIDLNPHGVRYGRVFPKETGVLLRFRLLLGDVLSAYWGRQGLVRPWGPYPFERDREGVLRLFTYTDVAVIPGAVERLKACHQQGYFSQESVLFTWMSNPDYLQVAQDLMRAGQSLGVNRAQGLWCPRSFEEILGWYASVREKGAQVQTSVIPGGREIRIETSCPCPVFTVALRMPARARGRNPEVEGMSPGTTATVEVRSGWVYVTSEVVHQATWRVRW